MTKIAPDGVAEKDGRLRLGDKVLSVSGLVGRGWDGCVYLSSESGCVSSEGILCG